MATDQFQIAKDYSRGKLIGWAEKNHPGLVKSQFSLLSRSGFFQKFKIVGQTKATTGKKVMLYQVNRKVLGKDTPNYGQQDSDCVSFAAKNCKEYLQCCQILMQGKNDKFKPVFPPYEYGTGRVYIGKGQLGNEGGSLGTWQAAAVQKYGTLFADEPGVPQYSGKIAVQFGDPDPRPDLDKFKEKASPFLIKTVARVKTWDQMVAALVNGYLLHTCSNVGYSYEPGRDGFHQQIDEWAHGMTIIGADDNDKNPYGIILNSWGERIHGELKDFDTGEPLPGGVLRVRRADIEKHLRAETFVWSNMVGFPEQDLEKKLFDLVGN